MLRPFKLALHAIALTLRVVRFPFDLLFLSFDLLRYTAWTLGQLPLKWQDMLRDPFPPCVKDAALGPDGLERLPCSMVRKYGNPFLLRFLFPGITASTDIDGKPIWVWHPDCIRSPTTVPRYLAVAAVLALCWGGVGMCTLSGRVAIGAPARLAARLLRPARPGVPAAPATVPVEAKAERAVAAEQLLASKSWQEARQAYARILMADPANLDAWVGKGLATLELGNLEEARSCFDTVLARSPRHPKALLALATLNSRVGMEDKAVESLKLLLFERPDYPRAEALLAECSRRQGRLDEGLVAARKALQATPDDREALLAAGRIYLQKQDYGQADACFAKAIELDPSDPNACIERAAIQRQKGDLPAWQAELTAVLEKFPDELSVVLVLVDAHVQQGSLAKALDLCKTVTGRHSEYYRLREIQTALLLDAGRRDEAYLAATALLRDQPGNTAAHLHLATLFLQGGVPSLAEEHCLKAIAQGGGTASAHRLLARACMAKGDWTQAAAQFNLLLRITPDDPALLVNLAKCQAGGGNRAKAIETLEQTCKQFPRDAGAMAELGAQRFQDGKRDEALSCFQRAYELDPGNWSTQNNLAVLLLNEGKDLDRALDLARKAFEQTPGNPLVADTLGWILTLRGETAQAAPLLTLAFSACGNLPQVVYHVAELKSRLGDLDAARRLVKRALDLGDDFPDAERARDLAKRLAAQAGAKPR